MSDKQPTITEQMEAIWAAHYKANDVKGPRPTAKINDMIAQCVKVAEDARAAAVEEEQGKARTIIEALAKQLLEARNKGEQVDAT